MRLPVILGSRLLGVVALPVALVATAGFVTASSYSVFSATTSSPSNSFTTGSVVLKNDSSGSQSVSGSALYTATGVSPTWTTQQKCVTVQSSGSLASTVKLFAQNAANTNSGTLAQYLKVTVDVGTATSTASGACTGWSTTSTLFPTGTLASFETTYPSYASGLGTGWSPTGSSTETKSFRFTVQADSAMPNTQQSVSHTVDFVWEADQS